MSANPQKFQLLSGYIAAPAWAPAMMGPRVPDRTSGVPFSLPTDSCTGSGRQMVEQVRRAARCCIPSHSFLCARDSPLQRRDGGPDARAGRWYCSTT